MISWVRPATRLVATYNKKVGGMQLNTYLAGVELEHPVMNAAGTCKTLQDVERMARSAVSVITVGSITFKRRQGNQGNVLWLGPHGSLNAPSLPNPGRRYYWEKLCQMVEVAHAAGKKLAVSIAGFSPEEFSFLARLAYDADADFIELNFGCPNVWEAGRQKNIVSFEPAAIEAVLAEQDARIVVDGKLGVKLSPFSDPWKMAKVAEVIRSYVRYVVACNAFPNGLGFTPEGRPVIDVGLAGVGGPAMKPIVLGQVAQLRQLLPQHIDIVGVGGVGSGQDVLDYRRAGASAVQVATAYFRARENPGVFSDILEAWVEEAPDGDGNVAKVS